MKRIWYIAACALIVCSCSKDSEPEVEVVDDNSMRFSADYPATTRATESAFEKGDVMGVFATKYNGDEAVELQISGNHGNNAPYLFDGVAWSSDLPIYWEEGKFDIYAYYPYMELVSVTDHPFSVATDQSTPESEDALGGYEASDLLWAKTTGVEQATITGLTFTHRLSKVAVHLLKGDDYEGELPDEGEVFIHNTVAQATIDVQAGYATKNPYVSAETIKAKQVSSVLYEAIVIPQRISSSVPLFELVMQGVSYLVETTFVFSISTQHNIYITINSDPDKVKIEIGGEIVGGWE